MILAPMQGLTEVLFRRCYEQCFPHVFDKAVSPFLSLTHGNLADAWKKISDVLPENNVGSIPVVPQILGKEGEAFVQLANRLASIGFDEVNWNIGCPMRRVAGKHRGSGILPYPGEVRAVLDYVVPRLQGIRLSVKMRLGHVSDREFCAIVPILNDYPLASVTLHPRTGKQQYGGQVNLDLFGEVLASLRHPVIYNGDIRTKGDFDAVTARFPAVADVMIGRGTLFNPQLPPTIKGMPLHDDDNIRFIRCLADAILRLDISDEGRLRKIKEYWCLLWHATGITEERAHKVLRKNNLGDTCREINEILLSLHDK